MAYSWKNRYYKLTKDQRERGVIYSSQLVNHTIHDGDDVIHEVFRDQEDKYEVIARLKDVKFFKNMAKDFGYNVEHIQRS